MRRARLPRRLAGLAVLGCVLLFAWPSAPRPVPGTAPGSAGWSHSGKTGFLSDLREFLGDGWDEVLAFVGAGRRSEPLEAPLDDAITFRGRFIDAATGLPIPGIHVRTGRWISDWSIAKTNLCWDPEEECVSGIDGTFELRCDWSPGWYISLTAENRGWSSVTGAFLRLEEGSVKEISDTKLTRTPWLERVQVVDASRSPIDDFEFEWRIETQSFAGSSWHERMHPHRERVRTDRDGFASLGAPASQASPRSVPEVDPVHWLDQSTSDGVLRVSQARSLLEGTVVDAEGSPLPKAWVQLVGYRNVYHGYPMYGSTHTDAQGRFRFVKPLGSPERQYELFVCPDGGSTRGSYSGPHRFGQTDLLVHVDELQSQRPVWRPESDVPVRFLHMDLLSDLLVRGKLMFELRDEGRYPPFSRGSVDVQGTGKATVHGAMPRSAQLILLGASGFMDFGTIGIPGQDEIVVDFSAFELGSLDIRLPDTQPLIHTFWSNQVSVVRTHPSRTRRTAHPIGDQVIFPALPPGQYEIFLCDMSTGVSVTVKSRERTSATIDALPSYGHWDAGLIWPDGSPAAGLPIVVRVGNSNWRHLTRTDEHGVLQAPRAPSGAVRLTSWNTQRFDRTELRLELPPHVPSAPVFRTHTIPFGPGR